MHKKTILLWGVVAFLISFPAFCLNSGMPFTIAEAKQARDSAISVLRSRLASPYHRYVSWVDDGNLVIAHEPNFVPEIIVARSEVGAVTRSYSSMDGQSIFYIREGSGSPKKRDLLLHDVYGEHDAPILIATGIDVPSSEIVVAPDGRALVFVEGAALFEFRRSETGQWRRRSLLDSGDIRHRASVNYDTRDVAYSPDGLRIAFVSERKAGQSYVAVHDTTNNQTSYTDPSVFQDGPPVWSPDGSEIAFVRRPVNKTKDYRFSPDQSRAGGAPWSIMVANIKTGKVRAVWKADHGAGSIPSSSRLEWAKSGEILFRWEKTGWNLLYAIPANGGVARLLTPGKGEVSRPGMSADGHTLVYFANFGDPMRYHLWSVSLKGGEPIQLTSGGGTEWTRGAVIGFNASGYLTYVSEDSDNGPPRVMIRSPDGKVRPLRLQSDHTVERNQAIWDHFLPTEVISVQSDDGVISHHVVIRPSTPPPVGGYPVIVNAHGGPVEQTLPSGGYAYAFGQYAASQGYLFVDINYRGSMGFGLDYRLPEGRGATGGSELKDLVALVGYLKNRPDVNPKRVGISGASYGGHIVGLAMSRLPDDFSAGVSQFGVADWVVEMKKDKEVSSGEVRDPLYYHRLSERIRIEDLAYASSPNSQIENWRGPTLLTIGDLDQSGHMEAVQDLGYELLKRGVQVEFQVDPSGGHDVFAWEKVFDFFERTLFVAD